MARKITAAKLPGVPEITSDLAYGAVAGHLAVVVALEEEVNQTFDPIIAAQRAALKTAQDKKALHMRPLQELEAQDKKAMAAWIDSRKVAAIEDTVGVDPEELMDRLEKPAPKTEAVASVREVPKFQLLPAKPPTALLRPDYLAVDEVKIGKVVRALGEAAVETVSLDPAKPAIKVWMATEIAAKRSGAPVATAMPALEVPQRAPQRAAGDEEADPWKV